jgi:transposase
LRAAVPEERPRQPAVRQGCCVIRLYAADGGTKLIAATAIIVLAPLMEAFRRSRDFAAWLGLAPTTAFDWRQTAARQHLEDGRA